MHSLVHKCHVIFHRLFNKEEVLNKIKEENIRFFDLKKYLLPSEESLYLADLVDLLPDRIDEKLERRALFMLECMVEQPLTHPIGVSTVDRIEFGEEILAALAIIVGAYEELNPRKGYQVLDQFIPVELLSADEVPC